MFIIWNISKYMEVKAPIFTWGTDIFLKIYLTCSIQFSHSVVFHSATPWTAARQASLSIANSRSLLKLLSIKSLMPSSHLILCRPLLLLPSIFPIIRIFSRELVLCIRWPKYWSFSFSISPSNEYSGLISFRMDWLDLLAVQVTFKSLLQYHSSNASILWHSAFFMAQLSHPYMTTGKTIALTRRIFVGKVMSLLFNMLSRLVTAFLLRRKHLLTSWLRSPSAMILEPKKIVCHCFHCFPIHLPWSKNKDHGIRSHHFMGNRRGNSGNSVRLYFFGLQNHCRWWL